MTASPAKVAEPIDILLGVLTWVSPKNHVSDRAPDHPQKWAFLRGWRWEAGFPHTLPMQQRSHWPAA